MTEPHVLRNALVKHEQEPTIPFTQWYGPLCSFVFMFVFFATLFGAT